MYESVSFSLMLDLVEHTAVPDSEVDEFLRGMLQVIQQYKLRAERNRGGSALADARAKQAAVPNACLRATHNFLSSYIVLRGAKDLVGRFESI